MKRAWEQRETSHLDFADAGLKCTIRWRGRVASNSGDFNRLLVYWKGLDSNPPTAYIQARLYQQIFFKRLSARSAIICSRGRTRKSIISIQPNARLARLFELFFKHYRGEPPASLPPAVYSAAIFAAPKTSARFICNEPGGGRRGASLFARGTIKSRPLRGAARARTVHNRR